MKTIEVLKTARGFAAVGASAEACCIGDWPEAADAFRRANRWRIERLVPIWTRGMLVRAFTRAIQLLEREDKAR